jgi:hypothetical protein
VANFSKVFGYIFDATPPTEIIDTKTGKVMSVSSDEVQNLMKENDAPTIERLIEKLPYIKISGRENPSFSNMEISYQSGNISLYSDSFIK